MPQFPYAAVSTRKGHMFAGGVPVLVPDYIPMEECATFSVDGLVPRFTSNKISSFKAVVASINNCMLKDPSTKFRDFSVNDCHRKVTAKNEKRRNRRIWQEEKKRICTAMLLS